MHESYTYEIVNLPADSGKAGPRTFDLESAKSVAIQRAQQTHRRQVIEAFPYENQPSRTIYRVVEADIDHVLNPEDLGSDLLERNLF